MGTRSLTRVYDGGEIVVNMYRQMDGYPQCHGQELAEFLKDRIVVNGMRLNDPPKTSNGPGCLAAQMVAEFKGGEPGHIYLYPTDTRGVGEEYVYNIFADWGEPIRICIVCTWSSGEKTIFYGLVSEFIKYCEDPPMDDDDGDYTPVIELAGNPWEEKKRS